MDTFITALAVCDEKQYGSFQDAPGKAFVEEDKRPETIFSFNKDCAPSDAAVSSVAALRSELKKTSDFAPDLVISCTQTPDTNNPGLVSRLLHKLDLRGLPGLELKQLSVAPQYAIDFASKLLDTGEAEQVLIVATEFLSRYFSGFQGDLDVINDGQKFAAANFGDGSGALLLSSETEAKGPLYKVLGSRQKSFGHAISGIHIPLPAANQFPMRIAPDDIKAGRHLPELKAEPLWESLEKEMPLFWESVCSDFSISLDQLRAIVFHQPFGGLSIKLAELLSLDHNLFIDVFSSHGFTGAAGPILALSQLSKSGCSQGKELKSSDKLLLLSVGSGPAMAATILEVHKR